MPPPGVVVVAGAGVDVGVAGMEVVGAASAEPTDGGASIESSFSVSIAIGVAGLREGDWVMPATAMMVPLALASWK